MSRRLLLFAVLFSLVLFGIVWDRANLGLVRSVAPLPAEPASPPPDDPDEIVMVIGGTHEPVPPATRPAPRADGGRTEPPARPRQGPPSAPPDRDEPAEDRRVRVEKGDTLRSIATRELGNPALWEVLARANGIADPTRLREGEMLVIPVEAARRDFP